MTWTEEAWNEIAPIYEKILKSKFVTELGDGTLSAERFATYMQQDKLYLNDYGRALAYIAARAPTPAETAMFARFAVSAAEAEQELHNFYLNFHQNKADSLHQLETRKKHVTCELYTSFLLRHASCSPIEIAAAAVLPCFWIYDAVGIHHRAQIQRMARENRTHPYVKWIEMYSSAEFTEGTRQACDFANKLAETASLERQKEMIEVFKQASLMELMFWQAAYDNEQWIV